MNAVFSPLSGASAELLFETSVLGKYRAQVFSDQSVPFLFFRDPTWLAEAYSDELPSLDTGMLQRNISLADRASTLLNRRGLAPQINTGVDVGGGYGLFVRAMRDRGFEFFWSDPHSRNLAAKGFEASDTQYDVATAFEVLEHVPNPIQFVSDIINRFTPKVFLFTTECFSPDSPPPRDWWYFSPETGQHISFYSAEALRYIAAAVGYEFYDLGGSLFAFSKVALPSKPSSLTGRAWKKAARMLGIQSRTVSSRKSLVSSDFERLRARANGAPVREQS